jgi:hypothetical protein
LGALFVPMASQPAAQEPAAEDALGCGRDIGADLAALLGGAPLVLADFQAGTDGSVDASLAAALAVGNGPRETTPEGLVYPSDAEAALQHAILSHPCFRSFQRAVQQGDEDVSGTGRGVLQLQMPIARTYDLTVEYVPQKFRRNFLVELSFSLELRDAKGRLVFAKTHGENYRRTCFWEGAADGAPCLDLQRNPVNLLEEWHRVLDRTIGALWAESETGLADWRRLLDAQTGAFRDRRYSTDLELNARQVRNREELALPYLFVQTPAPRVNINGLLAGFRDRGFSAVEQDRDALQNHHNVLFRSFLDRSLRAAFAARGAAANARVVLLSDTQSAAFQNAMTVVCAEQSQGFDKDDCLEPIYLIERLCDAANPDFGNARNPRGDVCLLASFAYGESLTRTTDEALGAVREAEQHIQGATYLRAPENARDPTTVSCTNDSKELVPLLVGVSPRYNRIDGAAENDDGLYLIDAALDVMAVQADCMADQILTRFQSLNDDHP